MRPDRFTVGMWTIPVRLLNDIFSLAPDIVVVFVFVVNFADVGNRLLVTKYGDCDRFQASSA